MTKPLHLSRKPSFPRSVAGGALLVSLVGCEPMPMSDAEAPAPAPAVQQAQTATGCAQLSADYGWVGGAYDALTGGPETFPFQRQPDGRYEACETPSTFETSWEHAVVSNAYEMEKLINKKVEVSGGLKLPKFSLSASAARTFEQRITYAQNTVAAAGELAIYRKTVTLGSVPFRPEFLQAYSNEDSYQRERQVHDEYGDLFVKSVDLGHRMLLVLSAEFERGSKYTREDFEVALKAKYNDSVRSGSFDVSSHSTKQIKEMWEKMRFSVKGTAIGGDPTGSAVFELTPAAVQNALTTFQQNAARYPMGPLRVRLEPYTQKLPQGGLFDYTWWVSEIDRHATMRGRALEVASSKSRFRNLEIRAQGVQEKAAQIIEALQNPFGGNWEAPGWQHWFSGVVDREHADMVSDDDEYKRVVNNSFRLENRRNRSLCISLPKGSPGEQGDTVTGGSCENGHDELLFRYDSPSKRLLTVSGMCLDINGGGPSGDLHVFPCHTGANQKWSFVRQDVKISTWSMRTLNFLRSEMGTNVRAYPGARARATSYSRDSWGDFDWELLQR